MSAEGTSRRSRRGPAVVVLVAVLAVGSIATLAFKPWQASPRDGAAADRSAPVTVPAEMSTLTDQVRLNALLDYGEPIELPAVGGVITALPAAGQVIELGSPVYEANGSPVILLRGERPLWRDLTSGVSNGQDVLQLEQNLERLGFFEREPDTVFDWWTTDAIKKWQRSLGVPQTGTVAMSDVVYVDASSIRVAEVSSQLGQSEVIPLAYTESTLRAIATLTTTQARNLNAGTPVVVQLPDGTELENTLAAINRGGQPTGEDGQSAPPTAMIEFADQAPVEAVGPVSVRVIITDPDETDAALTVPVTALIATAEDGYAIEVLHDTGIHRVPVELGRVADARVQILSSGPDVEGAPADAASLAEGDEVVIAG